MYDISGRKLHFRSTNVSSSQKKTCNYSSKETQYIKSFKFRPVTRRIPKNHRYIELAKISHPILHQTTCLTTCRLNNCVSFTQAYKSHRVKKSYSFTEDPVKKNLLHFIPITRFISNNRIIPLLRKILKPQILTVHIKGLTVFCDL